MKFFPFFILLMLALLTCDRDVAIENIDIPPGVVPSDKRYVGVFMPLEGVWRGFLRVYRDTGRTARASMPDLRSIEADLLQDSSLVLSDSVLVELQFINQTPYFQEIDAIGFIPESGDTLAPIGVHKIQNGEMWRVLKMPEATLIYEGEFENENRYRWERVSANPFLHEFSREKVEGNIYEIIGWRYSGTPDTTMSPPVWFHGIFLRQE